jgi:hypothetical protein
MGFIGTVILCFKSGHIYSLVRLFEQSIKE